MSLLFLPPPYPDELFISIYRRYHMWIRNRNICHTSEDFYGNKNIFPSFYYPRRLESIFERLPPGTINTPDKLIKDHTLFPLIRPFIPIHMVDKVINCMKDSEGGIDIIDKLEPTRSNIKKPSTLRYCPECVKEDQENFGEFYFHRSHQPFGVHVCHKHHTWLSDIGISTKLRSNRRAFLNLEDHDLLQSPTAFRDDKNFDKYLSISKAVYWLLNTDTPVTGLDGINKRYSYYLKRIDMLTPSGKTRRKGLIDQFEKKYGKKFLRKLQSNLDPKNNNWLFCLIRDPRSVHPIRHLLLILFLEHDIAEFFQRELEDDLPFGKGPWPCLNPAASHYRQPVIEKYILRFDTHTKTIVGKFVCKCGFVYTRRGPDCHEEDRFKKNSVITYGAMWEKKFLHMVDIQEKTLKEVGHHFGICVGTVMRIRNKLRNQERSTNNATNEQLKRDEYREYLQNLIKRYPHYTRSDLRKFAENQYAWGMKNDRDWVEENFPAPIGGFRKAALGEDVHIV